MSRPTPTLEDFASDSLDWPAVRAQFLAYAPSAIGHRALGELVPRDAEGARRALVRTRELLALSEAQGEPPLGGLGDPVPPMARAAEFNRSLDGDELQRLGRFLRVVEDVGHWLAGRRTELEENARLWEDIPDLTRLREELERSLDRKGRVRDEASPRLAKLREKIGRLEHDIGRRVKELANSPAIRASLAEGHAGQVHLRGGRRVLAVRQRHAGRVPGMVHDRSQSGETIFVEPRQVIEAANELSALQADADREAARILAELTRSAMAEHGSVKIAAARVAEIELAVVGARYARDMDGRPARLPGEPGTKSAGLLLRTFRHPLLVEEQRSGNIAEVCPIDLRLGDDFDLLVITGPNTGGKTLAIKSAGLAALLTRLGLPLPCAEGTTVPLFDGVVADIGDEQEIQQNLSTFSSHLARIRDGLARATRKTLVLLDELGGGTDPTEGAALGEALLEHLVKAGTPTLASTHLGQLKEFAFRFDRVENGHVEFDVATLAPAFRLVIGAPGESRALAIARRLGLPASILDRAHERIDKPESEAADLMVEMRDVRLEAERLRGEAEERLMEAEREVARLGEEAKALEAQRDQLEAEAQRGIEERMTRARASVDKLRAQLPQIPQAQRKEQAKLLEELDDALADALLTDRRKSFIDGLKKGESVWLPRFKKRCQVMRIHKEKRQLEVRVGKHDMRVSFDDVTFYESL